MATNQILKFCQNGDGSNLPTQEQYQDDPQRLIGNQPGVARSQLVNKAARQASYMANALAQFIADESGEDVLDNNQSAELIANLKLAISNIAVPVGTIIYGSSDSTPPGFLKCNGAAVSRSTYAKLFNHLVTEPNFPVVAATLDDAVFYMARVKKTAHGFKGGERIRFSGVLPDGLDPNVDYLVGPIEGDPNMFRVLYGDDDNFKSPYWENVYLNVGEPWTGTIYYQQTYWGLGNNTTTFNVPDLRGTFIRTLDEGRGLDQLEQGLGYEVERVLGSPEKDSLQYHSHAMNVQSTGSLGDANAGMATRAGFPRTDPDDTNQNWRSDYVYGNAYNTDTGMFAKISQETRPRNYALIAYIKY